MGDPALDIKVQQLAFVCDEPSCELARGSFGLTAEEIRARVVALQGKCCGAGWRSPAAAPRKETERAT